ncbi:MAG: RNA polymerase sigma-70 factor [Balneolaceae bacterium]|nr:RNA polymerase sigma-70 factor [Balneolaceae bacterium]
MDERTKIFEKHRSRLFRLAYSMLGRTAPAEDAVQEAFIRWQNQDINKIHSSGSYLSTIVSRICLDEIKSARNRREQYIGPDLPEPILSSNDETPEEQMELTESLSMAMLVVLDQLTPIQRAVFIFREIFDYDYDTIANMVDKSPSHCRKIAQRARDQIRENRPQFDDNMVGQQERVQAFVEAVQEGDLSEIEQLLAKDAILYSDGGGKVTAARKPIYGASKIARFMVGIQKQSPPDAKWTIKFREINGEPGMVLWIGKKLFNVWSFHIEEHQIKNIYVVLNPDKLEHIKHKL